MGWIIAAAILWFALRRWRGGMWSRRACLGSMYGGGWRSHAGRWQHSAHHMPVQAVCGYPARRETTGEGALESLKRRYVAGELSDEQYEQELDTLFRTTSGRGRA